MSIISRIDRFFLLIILHTTVLNHVNSTTYCPPLVAPKETNLSCVTSSDEQLVDCSSTWLPDGSIAYFRCTEADKLRVRFGKIVCKGNYEIVNNGPSAINNNQDPLPCGIQQMPANSEFHFYVSPFFGYVFAVGNVIRNNYQIFQGFEKSPHYPVLINVTQDAGTFRDQGLKLLNDFRNLHQALPLEMEELLNEKAQLWADTLANRNSLDLAKEDFIGQNVFNSDQTELSLAVNDAIQFWYLKGLKNYNWDNIQSNWENPLALDFSQIVWKSSRKFGLGASNRKFPINSKGTVVVAFYFPMGNVVLENETRPETMFVENVLQAKNMSSEM